jgi:uncharacterized protein YndB with AHSA1/START domain
VIEGEAVVHEVELAASPGDVFQMFVDPARLIRWIGIAAELEPRPGGRFRFEIQPGQYCEGEYVELDPPRALELTWGWTDPAFDLPPGASRVRVELTPSTAGTRLRLVHSRLPGQIRLLHDEGWAVFLDRLSAVQSGRVPDEYPTGDPAERARTLARDEGSA